MATNPYQIPPYHSPEYKLPTKYSRVEFIHFTEYDPRSWIYHAYYFLEVDSTPPHAKVKIIVHLEGKALRPVAPILYEKLPYMEIPSWEEYVRALNDRFGTMLYDDPMSELVNLKQTFILQQILDKFDELSNCVYLPHNYF